MNIGLLVCDDVPEDLQAEHTTYATMFERGLQGADSDMRITPYHIYQGHYPESMDECEGWLISGSRFGVYEDHDWIRKGMQLVREADKKNIKTVGCCFGHQLIIQAMGGDVQKVDAGWGIGVKTYDVIQQPDWMEPLPEKLSLLYLHQDQALSLPPDSSVIAGGDFCPNAMVQIGDNLLGIQGHPEFSKNYCGLRIKGRSDIIPADTAKAAMDSMTTDLNADLVFITIARFLKR